MRIIKINLILIFCFGICVYPIHADVESQRLATIKLTQPVQDMELSANGEQIFVLNKQGKVLIYSRYGELTHELFVGTHIDQIKVGPKGDELILHSRKDSTIEIVDLSFTYDIDITGSPFKGPDDAPVTVVVFSDFQCPYCARVGHFMDEIQKRYPSEVKYVFKHYPLNSHKYAVKAAKATVAAHAQGKFWEFHNLLFEKYNLLSDPVVEEIKTTLNIDKVAFEKMFNTPATYKKVQSDKKNGKDIGVHGTPAVYVNGKKVERNTLEWIESAVKKALPEK